jgi:DNA invertase Pin-like site-specific DNA recombinase
MNGARIGYIRVSTVEQNSGRQLEGLEMDRVFEDHASAAHAVHRPGWDACHKFLREGDTLYVHSIDRLARSLRDLHDIVRDLNERGVEVRFVKEQMVFGKCEASAFQILHFQILGAFAQFERALMLERQREGIARAKAEGKYLKRSGRPYKLTKEQMEQAKAMVEEGETKTKVAARLGVTRPVLYKILSGDLDPRRVRSSAEVVSK